jgi:metallo-beta-lactamase family protein
LTKLQFLGAAQTVTGSRHLLDVDGYRVLIDCGLFQGLKELRLRNWEKFPINPASINAVILTHAHIDHTGYLPRLVREGFRGPVYATPASVELARILLPDSATLQEEEAAYANRSGYTKHAPALPLYTLRDASAALKLIQSVKYGKKVQLGKRLSFEFVEAGHIIGSAFANMEVRGTDGGITRVLATGDIGRYDEPILNDPQAVDETDYLILESTYGDREHPDVDVKDQLAKVINDTAALGGHVLIPAFAVGRTQQLVYLLRELEDEKRIPILPVFVDSPMAVSATKLYLRHREDHDLDMDALVRANRNPLATNRFHLARTVSDSKAVSAQEEPSIVISASGMATGGRILHHLRKRIRDERNTILFVGFQAEGTRGRRLVDGEKEIRMFGELIPVRARIEQIESLSAHGDWREILRWLSGFKRAPKHVFLVHGEPRAALALETRIRERFGWEVSIPQYLDEVVL